MITLRHRSTLGDGAAFVMSMSVAATLLYFFDLRGRATAPQIDRDELLLLGAGFLGLLAWFGLRRIREQERQIARTALAETEARHIAHHDQLTGLPNRRGLQLALDAALAQLPAAPRQHALLLFDLNGFKQINDIHGHARGDSVLAAVASRMAAACRPGDTFARLGGDEFALVVRDIADAGEVERVGRRIAAALQAPIKIEDDAFHLGTGVGAALAPTDGQTMAELLRKADLALYRAKAGGGSSVVVFDAAIEADTLAKTGNIVFNGKALIPREGKDYAIVVRVPHVYPNLAPSRYFFVCAGRTASGTAAAGQFLSSQWRALLKMYSGHDLKTEALIVVIDHNFYNSDSEDDAAVIAVDNGKQMIKWWKNPMINSTRSSFIF